MAFLKKTSLIKGMFLSIFFLLLFIVVPSASATGSYQGKPYLKSFKLMGTAYGPNCKAAGCSGTTASGLYVGNQATEKYKVIAVGVPDKIPYGTIGELVVDGQSWGLFSAEDTGCQETQPYCADILYPSEELAAKFGRRWVTFHVLEWGNKTTRGKPEHVPRGDLPPYPTGPQISKHEKGAGELPTKNGTYNGNTGEYYSDDATVDGTTGVEKGIGDIEFKPTLSKDYFTELLAQSIMVVPQFLVDSIGLRDVNELVLGMNVNGKDEGLVEGVFPNAIAKTMTTVYNNFNSIAGYLMVIAIGVWSIILLTHSSEKMGLTISAMNEQILMYIVFGVMLGGVIISTFFYANQMFVDYCRDVLIQNGVPANASLFWTIISTLGEGKYQGSGAITLATVGAAFATGTLTVGIALIIAFFVILTAVVNYQYMIRMIWLAIFIAIFPICAYASVFPTTKNAFGKWFKEFTALVLMQTAHAILLVLFFLFLKS